jgi:hypothetical protein
MTAAPARVETLETEMLETPRADVPQLPPHASGRELPDIRVESLPDLEAGGTVQEAPQFEAPQR